MRPIELKIAGLNSFNEMQTIDFDYLTKDGLFGIVGQTGCGKTTVVDAITMAMYGEMPRYDGDPKKLKECVNSNTDEMYVSFKFQICEGDKLFIYTAERKYKKRNDKLNSVFARLSVGTENASVIADSVKDVTKEVTRITGLNYDDFTRSVVLPQGKFSQFLLLANKDRRDMLERIFNFSKYGDMLVKRVLSELNEKRNGISQAVSNIALLGDVSEEAVNTDKENAALKEARILELKSKEKEVTEESVRLTELKNAALEYEKCAVKKSELELKEAYIKDLKSLSASIMKAEKIKAAFIEDENGKKSLVENSCAIKETEELLKSLRLNEENAKTLYDMLFLRKETEYPRLKEMESRLKQAAEEESERDRVLTETAKLEEETAALLKEADRYKSELDKQRGKKEATENDIKAALEEKILLTVLPEHRQEVSHALMLQEKRAEGLAAFSELKLRYAELNKAITENNESLSGCVKDSEELGGLIIELERLKKEDIAVDDEKLRQMNEEVIRLFNYLEICEAKWIKLQKYNKENEELTLRLLTAEKEEAENNEKIKENTEKLKQMEASFNELKNKFLLTEAAKNLAERKPCPVCGSLEHPSPYGGLLQEGELGEAEDALKILTGEKEALYIKREKIQNGKSHLLELKKRCDENIKENHVDEPLDTIRVRYNKACSEYEIKKEAVKAEKNKRAENEKLLGSYTEKLGKISVERALTEERLQKDTQAMEKVKEELSQMHERLKELREEVEAYAKTLGNADFKALAEKIEKNDKRRQELDKEEEHLRAVLAETVKKTEAAQEALNISINNSKGIEAALTEKKARLAEIIEKINSVTCGSVAADVLNNVRREITSVIEECGEAGKKLEEAGKKRAETDLLLAGLMEKHKTLKEFKLKTEVRLKELVMENGFSALEEAQAFFPQAVNRIKYEEEIKAYEEEYISVKARYDAAFEKLTHSADYNLGTDLKLINEKLTELMETHESVKNEIEHTAKETAVLLERISAKTEARKKYLIINEEKKKLEYEAGLLEDLYSLFKGNKFAEALSYRQLKYIAMEATRRLGAMTSGRYSLELQDLEFVIRDDFNGGIRRSPKTLSGGETFMVSLCLSLALSSKIQMKNSAPLEFFFLDEGFGTLDNEAVETVMETLEKLRMEKLSVGVITHIEEIKNRLSRKLIIMPPVQGVRGSKVIAE